MTLRMPYILIIVFLIYNYTTVAQELQLRTTNFNVKDAMALQGYDPVSYFVEGKAKEGNKEFEVTYKGIQYQFNSQENKRLFLQNPNKYEPQYGGWCAYAMSQDGSRVKVDPETFKIIDGQLYLFYNFFFTNTLKSWNEDETKLKDQADSNWQKQI